MQRDILRKSQAAEDVEFLGSKAIRFFPECRAREICEI